MSRISKTLRILLLVLVPLLVVVITTAQDGSEDPLRLLQQADLAGADVYSVQMEDDTIHVCLDVLNSTLPETNYAGIEQVLLNIRYALTPLDWRILDIQAYDIATNSCVDIADWLPVTYAEFDARPQVADAAAYSLSSSGEGALAGKTIYISPGHGWTWYGSSLGWRTQRVVYEGFIEDHNNAEAVDQFLIQYLENAGATVIPVRERDWNLANVIVDNDDNGGTFSSGGSWTVSGGLGYDNSSYIFAETTTGMATSQATWTLSAPEPGNYAVYAWIRSGSNRAPDAQYRITHSGGTSIVTIDQRIRPETWRYLGTYPVSDAPISVSIDNHSAVDGTAIIADAIRLGGGTFNSLSQMTCTSDDADVPSSAPDKPWWETATYSYSQMMGFALTSCEYSSFNDVIARPIFARWMHSGSGEDAVYISWHTNGYRGMTRGTESYVYEGSSTYGRTEGSLDLQSAVHDELIQDIRSGWDPNWTDRGKKQADLGEVRMLWDDDPATRMPGVLLEIAFHDQADDAAALLNPRFNQLSARAVYQGIVKYFESRDGMNLTLIPESPTHVRVENVGSNVVRIAWHASPTDNVDLGGDPATSYQVYTSLDGFSWSPTPHTTSSTALALTFSAGEMIYFKVTAVNTGGESLPTEVFGARVGEAKTLIVSGFDKLNNYGLVDDVDPAMGHNLRMDVAHMNSYDYIVDHGMSIPAQYGGWDSACNEAVANGDVSLMNYAAIDWILGEETNVIDHTLNETERSLIESYLAQGGGLVISGAELGWDLVEKGEAPTWLAPVLKSSYVADAANTFTVQAVSGSIFDGLGMMTFDDPDAYEVNYADVFAPANGSTTAMTYIGGTGGGAVVVFDGSSKIVNFGFPIETMRDTDRLAVMNAVFSFLLPEGGAWIDTDIVLPDDGATFQASPQFSGTASGSEAPSQVLVTIQRVSDQLYWAGSSWSGETWLPATGTSSWSYSLPQLVDGSYDLRAKATVSGGLTDETPATVNIVIDSETPATLTGLSPNHGVWVETTFPELSWSEPSEQVAHYDVEIDHVTKTTNINVYTQYFSPGIHIWRVRAVDAAGNMGLWSEYRAFVVDVEQLFVPTVLRE